MRSGKALCLEECKLTQSHSKSIPTRSCCFAAWSVMWVWIHFATAFSLKAITILYLWGIVKCSSRWGPQLGWFEAKMLADAAVESFVDDELLWNSARFCSNHKSLASSCCAMSRGDETRVAFCTGKSTSSTRRVFFLRPWWRRLRLTCERDGPDGKLPPEIDFGEFIGGGVLITRQYVLGGCWASRREDEEFYLIIFYSVNIVPVECLWWYAERWNVWERK